MNLSKYFISVTEYLAKIKNYINEETYKYLYKLKDSHKVLVNGNELWFDDSKYMDEVFRPTLLLPKYQLDNLRVIIENKLVGVSLCSLDDPYENNVGIHIKPVGLITSDSKLVEYDNLVINYGCSGYVGLSGHGSHVINEDICNTYSCSGTLTSTNITPQSMTVNYINSSDDPSPVENAIKFILDNWFTKEELILLNKAQAKTLNLLYKLKVIDSFVDLATKEVYLNALLKGNISKLNDNDITFEGNRNFKYTYKGVDFNFSVCYNKTTNSLFIRTFTCDEEVDPRLKNYVENKLMSILDNTPVVIKESAKVLSTVIDEVQTYADNIYGKLIKSCSLGKNDYLSIIRNYPLNLINGNTNSIVNRVLLDFYGN